MPLAVASPRPGPPAATAAAAAAAAPVLSRWPPAAASTASMGGTGGAAMGSKPKARGSNQCDACGTTVYPLERVALQGRVFHERCARCATCNCVLTASNFASCEDGKMMCLPHFRQRFAASGGRYSFGASGTVAPKQPVAAVAETTHGMPSARLMIVACENGARPFFFFKQKTAYDV